jgi:hypothetical protein
VKSLAADPFNPRLISLSPLGNNQIDGADGNSLGEFLLLVIVNGIPRELLVTNITQTNPVVVNAPNHGYKNWWQITFTIVPGMYQLNGGRYFVNLVSQNTFALYTITFDSVDLSVMLDPSGNALLDQNGNPRLQ